MWNTSLQSGEGGSLIPTLGLSLWGLESQCFLQCLARVEQFLPKSVCSVSFPFPASLARESRVFFFFFLIGGGGCLLTGISSFLVFSSLTLGYLREKVTQHLPRTHHSAVSWVLRIQEAGLYSLFQNFLMFILYGMSRVASRERTSTPPSLKPEPIWSPLEMCFPAPWSFFRITSIFWTLLIKSDFLRWLSFPMGLPAFYLTQVNAYPSSQGQEELWAFRKPFCLKTVDIAVDDCGEVDADLLKLEIRLGVSFRISRFYPLWSLQGNAGVWAVLPIKNGLSQGAKVHGFASFSTAAVHYYLQEPLKSVPHFLPFPALGGRKHPPPFVCKVSGFQKAETYPRPHQQNQNTQILWLWHEYHFQSPKSSVSFNLDQSSSQSMVFMPVRVPRILMEELRYKTIFLITLRCYLPPSPSWYLHCRCKSRRE